MAVRKRRVPKRIAQTILNSLKGGVVPRIGLLISPSGGRMKSRLYCMMSTSFPRVVQAFHFIVGRYGSGKSFLLQTIRNYVMDENFVVVDGSLSPRRRLQGTKGQGLATYRELVQNMATKTRPRGWGSSPDSRSLDQHRADPGWLPGLVSVMMTQRLRRRLIKIYRVISSLSELVHGFDFAKLLNMYYHAYVDDDDETKAKVIRVSVGNTVTKRKPSRNWVSTSSFRMMTGMNTSSSLPVSSGKQATPV